MTQAIGVNRIGSPRVRQGATHVPQQVCNGRTLRRTFPKGAEYTAGVAPIAEQPYGTSQYVRCSR
jgi:hypothetical protein